MEEGASGCIPCSELTTLEQDIQRKLVEIRELLDRHRALRTKWNGAHDIISQMPEEIVSEIFQHCQEKHSEDGLIIQYPGETREVMKLGAVCQHWRQIAWSTPQLWTRILLQRPKEAGVLQEWISRSRTLPLSICVQTTITAENVPIWRAIFSALVACSERWRDLSLGSDSWVLKYLLRRVNSSSIIRCLDVQCNYRLQQHSDWEAEEGLCIWPDFPPVSTIHNARLEGSAPAQIIMNWKNLTHLVVGGVAFTDCRYILGEAPALISLRFECTIFDHEGQNEGRHAILAANPLVHRGLQSLIYSVWCPEVFFSFLTLPNLTHFAYSMVTDDKDDNDDTSLLPFILRSAFPLQKLELDIPFTYEVTRSILMAVPSITHLRIFPESEDSEAVEAQFMEELIATLEEDPISAIPALGEITTPQARARIHQFLPNLQILQKGNSDNAGPDYLRENKFKIDRVELGEA